MTDELKKRIDGSIAAYREGNVAQSDTLLHEAMALTITPEEKREAGAYLRSALGLQGKREDVDVAALLNGVKGYLTYSSVAKKYFGHGGAWLSQRLNGNLVNGKPASFTTSELMTLSVALADVGAQLLSVSREIKRSI